MWVAVALMTAASLTGCSSDNVSELITPEEPQQEENTDSQREEPYVSDYDPWNNLKLTRSEQDMVACSNDFAFNLFRRVYDEEKSQILSPISITYALGMLNNGAAGETRRQINEVLGFGDTGADGINAFCQKMLNRASLLDEQTKVLISNTIFMNRGYNLLPTFVEKAKTYYNAEPETRDFYDGKTLDVINQWASDHTEQLIEKVLEEREFNPDAFSYLLNAIYFKSSWTEAFEPEETREESFGNGGFFYGSCLRRPVQMMHRTGVYSYTENDLCQAICLPYGNGSYAMTVLLPREGKFVGDVLASLKGQSWEQNYRYLGETVLADVKLPRFETQTDQKLEDVMADLGMPKAFSDSAEFPDFCDNPTYIGMMKQVARIKLYEEGTEAAAVTVIAMDEKGGPGPDLRRVDFHADHPFIYVISERSTGSIFFIGQYMGD